MKSKGGGGAEGSADPHSLSRLRRRRRRRAGVVDVVVTDGFTGNIALKTAEGTAKQIGEYLRAAMGRSLLARLGAVLAQGAFRALKEKMDPRQLNGGIFLGLNGIVVKSHGGTDATGFACASISPTTWRRAVW